MSNFFSNIISQLTGSSGGDTAIGIDIGTSAIKIVQLKRENNKIKLDTYGALALGPYADKYVGQETDLPINTTVEALTDLLRESKTTTKQGGIAIPFSSAFMTVMEVPKLEDDEFEQMVPMEARKHVPTSLDEVSLDWTVIPKSQRSNNQREKQEQEQKIENKESDQSNGEENNQVGEKVDVLMVAIRNDIVDRYKRVVSRAELDALFFEVEIFSTIRAVLPRETEPVLVLDMGAVVTKVYIIENGIVRKTHTVNRGSTDVTEAIAKELEVDMEAAEILKRGMTPEGQTKDRTAEVNEAAATVFQPLLKEVNLFKKEYLQEHGELDRCVLVGGGVLFAGFEAMATEALSVPCKLANPFKDISAPAFLENVLEGNGPEFAVATGIALRRLNEE
ncbi:MAG: pilus assembly protein PilM [Candidatus Paceibacterota bacterium]